jgi:two-component system nitrogen regulation response regulator GlnG
MEAILTGTLAGGREAAQIREYECVFIDARLPDGNGVSLAREIVRTSRRPFVVAMTTEDDIENLIAATSVGADAHLAKPVTGDEVDRLLAAVRRRAGNGSDSSHDPASVPFLGIVGRSKAMRDVYRFIGRTAATMLPVLIEGEGGTGKRLVARAIHEVSSQAIRTLQIVGLAGMPRDEVAAALRGEEGTPSSDPASRGSQQVDRGTLVLDGIEHLPLDLQSSLVSYLRDGASVRRPGATGPPRVRIVALTSADLPLLVAQSSFRADLYHELCAFRVRIPSLAERMEDVPLLADHFALRDGKQLRARAMRLSTAATQRLMKHVWPGNVRELENVIRSGVLAAVGQVIEETDFEPHLSTPLDRSTLLWERFLADSARSSFGTRGTLDQLVDMAQRIVIGEALSAAHGNQTRAADLLGIHRNGLRRRMERLGMIRPGGANSDSDPGEATTDKVASE